MDIQMIKLMLAKEIELGRKLIFELCWENLKEVIIELEELDAQLDEETWEEIRHELINKRLGSVGHVDR